MKGLKSLILVAACAFAWPAFTQAAACPQEGNPGYIGEDGLVFLDFGPNAPDSAQTIAITTGYLADTPVELSSWVFGGTINLLLATRGPSPGFDPPPLPTCLSTSIGPLPAGDYTVQLVVFIGGGALAPPFVAAASTLTVSPQADDEPLAITGLMSSNWYDPDHGGEGMVVQVAAYPPDDAGLVAREFVFDWFTFDDAGNPFWISGNATIDPDHSDSVTSPAIYSTGGGFAGDFGASAQQNSWGTITFRFPDLDHMIIDYAAADHLPDGIPGGSGTLHYQRLLNIDGLCRPPLICVE